LLDGCRQELLRFAEKAVADFDGEGQALGFEDVQAVLRRAWSCVRERRPRIWACWKEEYSAGKKEKADSSLRSE